MDRLAFFQQLDEVLLTQERPSPHLEAMRADGTLGQCPELLDLLGVPQDPRWHPEWDVWVHTLLVVDEAVRERPADPRQARLLLWAALCHDLGKPACTVFERGAWRAPGHDRAGVAPTQVLLQRLGADEGLIDGVCRLVQDHLAPHFYAPQHAPQHASLRAVRRLLRRLGEVPVELPVRLGRADCFGRTTEQTRRREYLSGDWLLEQAALAVSPQP